MLLPIGILYNFLKLGLYYNGNVVYYDNKQLLDEVLISRIIKVEGYVGFIRGKTKQNGNKMEVMFLLLH